MFVFVTSSLCLRVCLIVSEVCKNRRGLRGSHHRRQRSRLRLLYSSDATEVFNKPARGECSDPWNFKQHGCPVAHFPTLAMKSDCKPMRFVANHLREMEYR